MKNLTVKPFAPFRRQRGISLIESIIAVGLMGAALVLVTQYRVSETSVDTGRKEGQTLQSFQALAAQYFINNRSEIEAAINASSSSDPEVTKHCVGFIDDIDDDLNLNPPNPADQNGKVLWSGTKNTCAFDLTLLQHKGLSPAFNVSHVHPSGGTGTFRHVAVFRREAGQTPDTLSADTQMLVLAVAENGGGSVPITSPVLKNFQGQMRVLGESGGVVPVGLYGDCTANSTKVEVCGQGWRFDLSDWVDDIAPIQDLLP